MRRTALVVGVVVLLVAAAATVSPRVGPANRGQPFGCGRRFNHDGVADLAVGVPGENGVAGAINVLYGTGVS